MTRQERIFQIDPILAQLDRASGLSDLQPLIEDLRTAFRVDHMVYHWVNAKGARLGVGTYSAEWVARYVDQGYIRVDPVIIGCSQHFHPVDWKHLDWSSRPSRQFQQDAIAHGVGNQGLSIPIRGPHGQYALFTVSHHCSDQNWENFIEDCRRDLIVLGHFFNKKVLELEGEKAAEMRTALSPREQETLTLLAIGYSRAQVASTLAISEHTLRAYIESARLKLGAQNTTHAVACAINLGLVVI